jgi:N-acyl-D-aspartate/D-glutamate deacylase
MPEMGPRFDTVIANGLFFDGRGSPPVKRHLGLKDGKVALISEQAIPPESAIETVDASERWVTPGFIDFHTHYDAELEFDPSLSESLRHGVTTVFLGSCSLGAAVGEPEDIADIFCRVEAVPRSVMLPMLQERKTWTTLTEYLEHLDELPLGPNVCSFVGHSNIRMQAMGFSRSVTEGVKPTEDELKRMEELLQEGLDAGYVGLSIQTLPWDKLDGDRHRSQPLPSFFSTWSEYRRLTRIVRARDRVFQGVPNIVTKLNVFLFLFESVGLFRKPLKTTVISVMDIIANRSIYWSVPLLGSLFNRLLNANFRFQALPNLFDVWADGMDLVIFEEFGAGSEAMHLVDLAEREELLNDPEYRARFRKQWGSFFAPRVYHRDFRHTEVLACPDASVVGRSFDDIAREQGTHPVDVFLDLASTHGSDLRWYSIMANDREKPLEYIVSHPSVLIGFSDAGAHLRNMAHYNFPLRMLRLVRDAEQRGEGFMSLEAAVHRLTGEIGQWFGVDAGVLVEGGRADLVVLNPAFLDEKLDQTKEEPMEGFGDLKRLVRRNPDVVDAVYINGRRAVYRGEVEASVGAVRGFGRVLRAGT